MHPLSDGALQPDQPVAEVATALRAVRMAEFELAAAMYRRVAHRWHALEALSVAS